MESYCNMNSSNGRCHRNPMNQGCRPQDRQNPNRPPQMMQNNRGKSMNVECVCKTNPRPNCHQEDPMDNLGDRFPTVMAYVPWQQWGELYEAEYGLMQGTIFKELNLIFCGVRC